MTNTEPQVQAGPPVVDTGSERPSSKPGEIIDAILIEDTSEIPEPPTRRGTSTRNKRGETTATGAPTAHEWAEFLSRVVLRFGCDAYISLAFRGIEEDDVSERDLERLRLDNEERERIVEPLATLLSKSRFSKKRGRTIIAFGGSWESIVTLGMWCSRVNRISRRYRRERRDNSVNTRPPEANPSPNGQGPTIVVSPGTG